MTKNRKRIYDCVSDASGPINANQIHKKTGSVMDLATIYRGLRYLEEEKLIASFVFSCEDRVMERYYTGMSTKHIHYMHCRSCHMFFPMTYCPFTGGIDLSGSTEGFCVETHSITLTGVCRSCQ